MVNGTGGFSLPRAPWAGVNVLSSGRISCSAGAASASDTLRPAAIVAPSSGPDVGQVQRVASESDAALVELHCHGWVPSSVSAFVVVVVPWHAAARRTLARAFCPAPHRPFSPGRACGHL